MFPNHAAAKAGVQKGDQIIAMDDTKLTNVVEGWERSNEIGIGKTVQLTIRRNGELKMFRVVAE